MKLYLSLPWLNSHIYFITTLTTDKESWEWLQERFKLPRDSDMIRDIYDGEGYKHHSHFLDQPANVSLLLNTDGVAIFHSSKVSLWPIWVIVNELPIRKRYNYYDTIDCPP